MQKTQHFMFELQLNIRIVFILFAVAFSSMLLGTIKQANAASDGSLAATSEGDTDMSLSVPDLVRVSNISDLNFGTYSGSGAASLNDNICIYNNNPLGEYKVTATGSGSSSAFTVVSGSSHTIPYTVKFNNTNGISGNSALNVNDPADFNGANTTSQTCSGGTNANFEVTFTQNDLMNQPAGTYSGVLTLMIEPG